jgi:predicted kinase
MSKLYLTVGTICAGKSTFAEAWQAESPDTRLVLDRDLLRIELFNDVRFKTNEQAVLATVKVRALEALAQGKDVCIADTNLYAKTRNMFVALAENAGHEAELIWLDITLKESLSRNVHRSETTDKVIGAGYVRGMFVAYLKERYPEEDKEEINFHYLQEKGNAGLLE